MPEEIDYERDIEILKSGDFNQNQENTVLVKRSFQDMIKNNIEDQVKEEVRRQRRRYRKDWEDEDLDQIEYQRLKALGKVEEAENLLISGLKKKEFD